MLIASVLLLAFVLGVGIYGLWRQSARISHVTIYGADQSLAELATREMSGSYFGIVPRDSTFFFPASRIRTSIVAAYPDIAAVSIFRNGLTGLSIKLDYRVPIARWCGLAQTAGVDEYCYLFDANGLIYAAVPTIAGGVRAATSSPTVNSFALYAPLEGDTLEPLGASIRRADKLPAVFDLARELTTLGAPVTSIVFRDDEVDLHTESGTRVTYVLAHEEDAFTALVSAKGNLNLADGSVEYVDLRFSGKVYVKRVEKK
jgi:cell division septal protein FtsQ